MSIFDSLKALFGGGSKDGADGGGGAAAPTGGETAQAVEMISCEEALRLVHEFLDGELESYSEAQVQQHFDVCQQCYPHLHLESAFRDAMRRAAMGESAPPGLKERIAALIAEAEEEG